MEGLQPPVDTALRRLLRRAVLAHAGQERRRVHPAALHVGTPGERLARFPVGPGNEGDAGLEVDVVAAMRARVREHRDDAPEPPLVWLTRAGELGELQDVDARWLAAARAAYEEADAPLVFVVVNRRGWRDPRSGLGRTWVRLRQPAQPVGLRGT